MLLTCQVSEKIPVNSLKDTFCTCEVWTQVSVTACTSAESHFVHVLV